MLEKDFTEFLQSMYDDIESLTKNQYRDLKKAFYLGAMCGIGLDAVELYNHIASTIDEMLREDGVLTKLSLLIVNDVARVRGTTDTFVVIDCRNKVSKVKYENGNVDTFVWSLIDPEVIRQ